LRTERGLQSAARRSREVGRQQNGNAGGQGWRATGRYVVQALACHGAALTPDTLKRAQRTLAVERGLQSAARRSWERGFAGAAREVGRPENGNAEGQGWRATGRYVVQALACHRAALAPDTLKRAQRTLADGARTSVRSASFVGEGLCRRGAGAIGLEVGYPCLHSTCCGLKSALRELLRGWGAIDWKCGVSRLESNGEVRCSSFSLPSRGPCA
jgi:hypothetical protein